jgi:hypothetical protein
MDKVRKPSNSVFNFPVLLPESQLISRMDLRKMGCEEGRWMELAQDHVQWRALVLPVSNVRILPPESQLISKMDRRKMGCEDGKWMELSQDHVQWRTLILALLQFVI